MADRIRAIFLVAIKGVQLGTDELVLAWQSTNIHTGGGCLSSILNRSFPKVHLRGGLRLSRPVCGFSKRSSASTCTVHVHVSSIRSSVQRSRPEIAIALQDRAIARLWHTHTHTKTETHTQTPCLISVCSSQVFCFLWCEERERHFVTARHYLCAIASVHYKDHDLRSLRPSLCSEAEDMVLVSVKLNLRTCFQIII